MPAAAVAAMASLQKKRGGEDHAPDFIEIIILPLDQLCSGQFRERRCGGRVTESDQAIPAETNTIRADIGQSLLHLGGNGERLAPARPIVGVAIGDPALILPPAHRTQLFSRQHLLRAVSKSTRRSASAKLLQPEAGGDEFAVGFRLTVGIC